MEDFWKFMKETRGRAAWRRRDMAWAILDSSVDIGHWEGGLYDVALADVRRAFVVRHSAVVLSELRRGARPPAAQKVVGALFERASVVWVPLAADWWDAGRVIRKIGDARRWDRGKRRDFQNDALIALDGSALRRDGGHGQSRRIRMAISGITGLRLVHLTAALEERVRRAPTLRQVEPLAKRRQPIVAA